MSEEQDGEFPLGLRCPLALDPVCVSERDLGDNVCDCQRMKTGSCS